MDKQFETVFEEFWEIEPLEFEPINAFYLEHKMYLENVQFNDEENFKKYKEIISDIAKTYAIAEKYEISLPLLKKAIGLKEDVKGNYFWLGMTYFNLNKPILAHYYFLKCKEDYAENEEFDKVLIITKKETLQKIYNVRDYVLACVLGLLLAYKWRVGEFEAPWLKTLYRVVTWYAYAYMLYYTYKYIRYKLKKK